MEHRVQRLIESIHREGSCPRLLIDLTRDGVVCPDHICEQWGERLIIDLDPSYPLDLAFTDVGVEADLSFGGVVTRCTFPYAAIYMVADRSTGKGVFFEENAPDSVRRERGLPPAPARQPAGPRPAARERAGQDSRRRRRRPRADDAAPEAAEEPRRAPLAAVASAPDAGEDAGEAASEAEAAADKHLSEETDRQAERRRAVFKVIDGGK